MSPCAASRPASDSLTTSPGSLRNLRIRLATWAIFFPCSCTSLKRAESDFVGVGDGFRDGLLDHPGLGQEVVDEGRARRADEAGQQVDGHVLRPVRGTTGNGGDQLRPEGAGGV